MPKAYYGISASTDLGDMVNIETLVTFAPQSTGTRFIRLMSDKQRKVASGAIREDGHLNGVLYFDIAKISELDTLVNYTLTNWTTASKELAISLIDERGRYSPFLAHVGKPKFEAPSAKWRTGVTMALSNLRLQTVTKTTNTTITVDERYSIWNTASGSLTATLFAGASCNANTVYSFIKSSASNSLIVDANGSETIDGATTVTLTALNARLDIYWTGSAWRSLVAV